MLVIVSQCTNFVEVLDHDHGYFEPVEVCELQDNLYLCDVDSNTLDS